MSEKINLDLLPEEERKAIEARRVYQKRWRENNKDRVQATNKRFWLKKAAELSNNQ